MRTKATSSQESIVDSKPALTPEARENRIIAKSYDLAERQIDEGTASSQVIAHFLKLGSTKEREERDKLREEVKLLKAKTEALEAQRASEGSYKEVLDALRKYSGYETEEEALDGY